MYLIIGSHTDGRWAIYIGTSSQLGHRIRTHALCVRAVRTHAGSNHQYCHQILGGDGWSVTSTTIYSNDITDRAGRLPTNALVAQMLTLTSFTRSAATSPAPASAPSAPDTSTSVPTPAPLTSVPVPPRAPLASLPPNVGKRRNASPVALPRKRRIAAAAAVEEEEDDDEDEEDEEDDGELHKLTTLQGRVLIGSEEPPLPSAAGQPGLTTTTTTTTITAIIITTTATTSAALPSPAAAARALPNPPSAPPMPLVLSDRHESKRSVRA